MQSIIYEWFDIRYMRNTPMVTFTIDKLRRLYTGLKTVEYDSGISDIE